jgi:hypothetical protein
MGQLCVRNNPKSNQGAGKGGDGRFHQAETVTRPQDTIELGASLLRDGEFVEHSSKSTIVNILLAINLVQCDTLLVLALVITNRPGCNYHTFYITVSSLL